MTDKQIIIDGVDVNDCHNRTFYKNDEGDVQCKCYRFEDADSDTLLFGICKQHPHCYYKQLKRKEKSEEKLVKQIQTICDFINNRPETFKGINGSVDKIITDYAERKEQECEELKKEREKKRDHYFMISNENARLEDEKSRLGYSLNCKIEKLSKTLTEIKEIAENAYCLTNSTNKDMAQFAKQILQKISECEVE